MSSRRMSPVWKVFERVDGTSARCRLCNHPYSTSGGTSNLRDHIRRRHPEVEQGQQLTENSDGGVPLSRSSQESRTIDRYVALFIAQSFQPFRIVELASFRKMLHHLNARYQPPCRRTVSNNLIPGLQAELKDKLTEALLGARWVALTTDTWTSNRQQSFLAVTVHFVHAGKLTSGCLDAALLPGGHSAENIAAHLKGVMDAWQIVGKVVAIVTDNASNMKAAIRSLGIPHMPCVAHTLHLVVCGAITPVQRLVDVLAKCGEIVSFFKHSTLASERLRDQQHSAHASELRLIQQVPTRWNSKLAMVRRLLEVKDHLIIAQFQLRNAPQALTADDWMVLEDFVTILDPFESATSLLSGEMFVTASLIIPTVRGLVHSFDRMVTRTPTGAHFKTEVVREVQARLNRYESTIELAQFATFLDPRYKKKGFMVQQTADDVRQALERKVTALLRKESQNQASSSAGEGSHNLHWPGPELHRFMIEEEDHSTAMASAILQLKYYVTLPPVNITMDPIEFWEGEREKGLKDMAQRYLCVPATSVPCERSFSSAGSIITDRRSNLSPSKASALMFIKGNERFLD